MYVDKRAYISRLLPNKVALPRVSGFGRHTALVIAPEIYVVRHAESEHNVSKDFCKLDGISIWMADWRCS